jgi:amino acid transporter
MATDTAASSSIEGRKLKRDVGLIGLLWASEGSIIGSGWLFGAHVALISAGPAALISWGIAAVIIIVLALVHAELGGMFPIAGGTARFPHYSFGGAAGASFGWFSWLQAAAVAPVEVEAMIQYSQHWSFASGWMTSKVANGAPQLVLTGSGIAIAIALMAVFVAINFLGVRMLARVNSTATWWKVGVPLLLIFVLAVTHFHGGNFTAASGGGFMPFGFKSVLLAIPGSGIVFALLGFEQAIQLAGESKNPKRDLPMATILSILIGAAVYILVQVVYIAALPAMSFAKGWANLSYANVASAPIAGLATVVGLGWLAVILYADAVVSPGGTALIYSTSTSRVSYGMSRNGYVPAIYSSTDRRSVPWFGLVTAFIAGCIFFLPFPSWQQLVGLITSASVLMYAGAPLAFGVMRSRMPGLARPYRLPGGAIFAPVAFILANLIILWTGYDIDYKLGITVFIGYLILVLSRVFNLNEIKPELDFKAAQWIPVYLIGLGVLTWLSSFDTGGSGSIHNPPLKFGWDMGAVALFSVVIYYWAQKVALPSEKIQGMIDEVVVVEESAH